MCRLLGYVARTPVTITDVVGDDLERFRHLARVHGDGWGAAWGDSNGVSGRGVASRVSTEAADESADFAAFAGDHRSDAAIVHLRWATQGLAVCLPNTHPFARGDVAFAHNGSVLPPESLDALIPADLAAARQGDTDSERLFLAVLARLAGPDGVPAAEALAATLRAIDASLTFTSLNCMLLTPDELLVACLFRADVAEARAIAPLSPDYYEMRYRVRADSVVAGSSGWPQEGWTQLRNGELLSVDRASLATKVTTLSLLAAER